MPQGRTKVRISDLRLDNHQGPVGFQRQLLEILKGPEDIGREPLSRNEKQGNVLGELGSALRLPVLKKGRKLRDATTSTVRAGMPLDDLGHLVQEANGGEPPHPRRGRMRASTVSTEV